ncbi:murein biosynthesis integral membrane protein MurJ [Amylibacter kogurei]|uniref:Probable lipid II flippase MurJ n=1 Tax=Paramylibacter kogurei TaxID=1889778 RepID=A0A2G5K4K4_9RHOB|nr:murein biosynthesis integral membrane protein MurJ [Amylibacter kogurei]PIB23943.1 murein biosynthesis integral membrane protein MurJ [Amylibacter kogurei]
MTNPIRLMASFVTVGGWTLISRIAGFAREILFANLFGSSATAEAFQVAFALPNMFRRFFAEGAFNMAFIPMFSKKLRAGENAGEFANDALNALATILIALSVIAIFAMPWLVYAMASGFQGDERMDLAITFGRVCFPYILFISLAALFSGVLNASGKFAAAAAAPVFLNFILTGAMLYALWAGTDAGTALVWGVPVAGVVQLGIVWYAAEKLGLKIRPSWPKWTPELKKLAIIAAPAAMAGGVVQINLLVGRQVASYYDGAIQWLAVADRLYQLPLGVVGIAIGVVLLPTLSGQLQAGDDKAGQDAFNRATEFSLFLTLPSAVALVVIALPLVSVLFERGAFLHSDSLATAQALAIYGLGLPAFVLQKVLQPLYFAREDTKTPFYFALLSMIINAAIAIGLAYKFGFLAAALGTTAAAWAMVILLWIGTRNMGSASQFDSQLKKRVPRIIMSSLIMGLVLFVAQNTLENWLFGTGTRYLAFVILLAIGMVSYFVAAHFTQALKISELRRAVRR